MNKKIIIAIGILLIVSLIIITIFIYVNNSIVPCCETSDESRFYGTWMRDYVAGDGTNVSEYWTLFENGTSLKNMTYESGGMDFPLGYVTYSWELMDNKLIITNTFIEEDATFQYDYIFSNNDKNLSLYREGSSILYYTKQ